MTWCTNLILINISCIVNVREVENILGSFSYVRLKTYLMHISKSYQHHCIFINSAHWNWSIWMIHMPPRSYLEFTGLAIRYSFRLCSFLIQRFIVVSRFSTLFSPFLLTYPIFPYPSTLFFYCFFFTLALSFDRRKIDPWKMSLSFLNPLKKYRNLLGGIILTFTVPISFLFYFKFVFLITVKYLPT